MIDKADKQMADDSNLKHTNALTHTQEQGAVITYIIKKKRARKMSYKSTQSSLKEERLIKFFTFLYLPPSLHLSLSLSRPTSLPRARSPVSSSSARFLSPAPSLFSLPGSGITGGLQHIKRAAEKHRPNRV